LADAKTEQERAKREEMLRKNREAAHKCRAKKKDWMTRMDEQHRDLSARNKFLRAELETLRESIFELKDLVLQHTDCGFAPIETYLQMPSQTSRPAYDRNLTRMFRLSCHHMHKTVYAQCPSQAIRQT